MNDRKFHLMFAVGMIGATLIGCAESQEAIVGDSEGAGGVRASAILVDGHNDLPWRMRRNFDYDFDNFDIALRHEDGHTDIPRLREGGVGAQFWAAYVPSTYIGRGAARVALEQIDLIKRMSARYPELEMAYTVDDVRRIVGSGRIASLIGIEGGHAIENSLGALRMFYALGTRYMTLTHSATLDWADSATDDPRHGGLSEFGEEVVREMNRLGMLVDISHVSPETMADVLRVSEAPVIASHSNARSLTDHARNVPDEILRSVAENGGVVMVNFYSGFVTEPGAAVASEGFEVWRRLQEEYPGDEDAVERAMDEWEAQHPTPPGTLAELVDHIDRIVEVAGIDHVGLGSDFDGISVAPVGLEDVSKFPAVAEELRRRGYSEGDIVKIQGENVLRAWAEAEAMARRLRAAAL